MATLLSPGVSITVFEYYDPTSETEEYIFPNVKGNTMVELNSAGFVDEMYAYIKELCSKEEQRWLEEQMNPVAKNTGPFALLEDWKESRLFVLEEETNSGVMKEQPIQYVSGFDPKECVESDNRLMQVYDHKVELPKMRLVDHLSAPTTVEADIQYFQMKLSKSLDSDTLLKQLALVNKADAVYQEQKWWTPRT